MWSSCREAGPVYIHKLQPGARSAFCKCGSHEVVVGQFSVYPWLRIDCFGQIVYADPLPAAIAEGEIMAISFAKSNAVGVEVGEPVRVAVTVLAVVRVFGKPELSRG